MANKPRVLVALTSQRMIFSRTAFSLVESALASKDYIFDFYLEMGADIASSRNRIVYAAQERKCSHLLFVDYDMYFPPTAIPKLIEADKDIIGAAYNFRSEDVRSTAVPVGVGKQVHPDELPKEPFKAEAMGAGLLLIKMHVFDKIKAPWFMFGYNAKGEMHFGEDTYFIQRALNEAKLEAWADPTLRVKHIGEQLF